MNTFFQKLTLLVVAFFSFGLAAQAVPPLVVGMELSYPPFEMTDARDKPTGISVEIAHALGEYLKRPVRIENVSYDGLIPALKTGKIDCIISSMTATDERAKSVDFSDAYLKTGLSLLVAAKSPVQSISDLNQKGRSVAVKKGTTGHQYAVAHLKKAKVLVLDRESVAVLEVSQGKVDAFIYDEMSVFNHYSRNANATRAILFPFKEESWAVAIRKGNVSLVADVNAFLKQFRAKGGFEKLGDKYLGDEKKAFKKLGVPFLF